MSFWDAFSNSSGGLSPWMKNQWMSGFNNVGELGNQLYGPGSVQRRVATFSNNLDANIRNQDAAGYGGLAARGMGHGDTTNGSGLYGVTRSRSVAGMQDQATQEALQGRYNVAQNQFGMLGQMAPFFMRQPRQGFGSKLLGAGGGLASMGVLGNGAENWATANPMVAAGMGTWGGYPAGGYPMYSGYNPYMMYMMGR